MRMNRFGQVARRGAHLDRKNALADQLPRSRSGHAHTQNSFGFGLDNEFCQTFGAIEG